MIINNMFHLRGFIHMLKNELEASIKDFTDALRLNPQNIASLTYRAEAKKQLGLKFCDDYKQACELGSNEYCLKYSQECK